MSFHTDWEQCSSKSQSVGSVFFRNVCSSSVMGYQFCYIKPAPSLSLFTKLPAELPLNCIYSFAHYIFHLIPCPLIASTVNKTARDLLKINADHKSVNVLVCLQSPSKSPHRQPAYWTNLIYVSGPSTSVAQKASGNALCHRCQSKFIDFDNFVWKHIFLFFENKITCIQTSWLICIFLIKYKFCWCVLFWWAGSE
jgi:hypothetical protein